MIDTAFATPNTIALSLLEKYIPFPEFVTVLNIMLWDAGYKGVHVEELQSLHQLWQDNVQEIAFPF